MHEKFHKEWECCRVSAPLLLRLFEFIRESQTSDEDLHFMLERITEMGSGGIRLTMSHYQSIVPKMKE
jgi:hypothetical protein